MEIENGVIPADVERPRAEDRRQPAEDPDGDVDRTQTLRT
jgi:hypothetical protein